MQYLHNFQIFNIKYLILIFLKISNINFTFNFFNLFIFEAEGKKISSESMFYSNRERFNYETNKTFAILVKPFTPSAKFFFRS